MSPSRHRGGSRRTRRGPSSLLAVLGVLLLLAGGGVLVWNHLQEKDLPRDLEGHPVRLEAQDTPAPEVVEQMQVRAAQDGQRLAVPSVGLDVPLGSLLEVDGEVTPPGFTEAYLIRNRGVPLDRSDSGTVYVVTHSVRDGSAPGNLLIDVAQGRSRVATGAAIQVGEAHYEVERTVTVEKGRLASTPGIWDDEPGRLVLITCLQRESGHSLDNVVIIARQVAG